MQNRRILVTGASGRLGSLVLKRLKSDGQDVMGSDVVLSETATVRLDLTDPVETHDIVQQLNPDLIVHTAAIAHEVDTYSEAEIMKVNLEGTRHLLEAVRVKPISRLVFLSTIDVYDPVAKIPISIDAVEAPCGSYGKSKLLAEKAIMDSGIPYTILRLAPVYSPVMTSDIRRRIPRLAGINLFFSPHVKRYSFLSSDVLCERIASAVEDQDNVIEVLSDVNPQSQLDIASFLHRRPFPSVSINAKLLYSFIRCCSRFFPKRYARKGGILSAKLLQPRLVRPGSKSC